MLFQNKFKKSLKLNKDILIAFIDYMTIQKVYDNLCTHSGLNTTIIQMTFLSRKKRI